MFLLLTYLMKDSRRPSNLVFSSALLALTPLVWPILATACTASSCLVGKLFKIVFFCSFFPKFEAGFLGTGFLGAGFLEAGFLEAGL